MHRVWIRGATGAGKSTLSAVLASTMGVPHVMIDDHAFLPGWVRRPEAEIRRRVAQAMGDGGWVVDGNWAGIMEPLVLPLADTVIWVDPPRHVVMRRLVLRTVRRSLRREVMYGGNRETLLRHLAIWDEDRSLWRWSWNSHADCRRHYPTLMADPDGPRWIRVDLRSVRGGTAADGRWSASGEDPDHEHHQHDDDRDADQPLDHTGHRPDRQVAQEEHDQGEQQAAGGTSTT